MVRICLAAASVLLAVSAAGAAWSQGQEDAPVATTSGGDPAWLDPDAKDAKPAVVPPPRAPGPVGDPLAALKGVRDKSFLANVHGSAGVMIGSHDTRGAFANVHGPIGENGQFALSFSTVRSDAMPYAYGYDGYGYGGYGGGYGYGGRTGYRGRGYGYGYGSGTSTSIGAAYTFGTANYRPPPYAFDFEAAYGPDWPGFAPSSSGEMTTDVTDDPEG